MPVTTGRYANYELQLYQSLLNAGLNTAAACGVLSNIFAESGFNPMNLQNSYESSLRYDDNSYTKAVNSGAYKNFIGDSAGYGLAQWTYSTRKKALYEYAIKRKKTSIGSLDTQIEFLILELKGETSYKDFKRVWDLLKRTENNAQGAYDAGYEFCREFEKPAGGVPTYQSRGNNARDIYWKYYSTQSKERANLVNNKGKSIVDIARDQLGKPYISGGSDPKGYDMPGLVYYVYNEAGIKIPQGTVKNYHTQYKDARKVNVNNISAGDIIFYDDDDNIGNGVERIAIATGEGSIIYADENRGVIESNSIGDPSIIIRLVADSETSSSAKDDESPSSIDDSVSRESYELYANQIATNLSRLESEGYDSGYLIDITNGGEFQFYVPEFSEQAGAQWSTVDIRGRSVEVKSYESTSSRTITVALDLYAGVGYYAPRSGESGMDTISRLHRDAYFLKSLEYPDYSNAIARPPATVHLILGSAIDISGVVSNVIIEHMKPVDIQNRSMYLKVSFTVTQTAMNPIDWSDVRRGQTSVISTLDRSSLDTVGIDAPINTPRTTVPSANLTSNSTSTNAPIFSQPPSNEGKVEIR